MNVVIEDYDLKCDVKSVCRQIPTFCRNSEAVIITVLKLVARKRLMKREDFYVSCDYNNNWSVWFSGTVIVGCSGDLHVVNRSNIQSETPSRDTLTRDSI
jgi:hypothetical protein